MQLYFVQNAPAALTALIRETLMLAPADPSALAYAQDEMATAAHPASAQEYYNRGVELTNAGRHFEAALTYKRALRFAPTSAEAANNLGWSLAKLGLYQNKRKTEKKLKRSRKGQVQEEERGVKRREVRQKPDRERSVGSPPWGLGETSSQTGGEL